MRLQPDFSDVSPLTGEPSVAHALIEIPKGCRNKFEVDKETGLLKLDRCLYSSSHYPGDYGFIPQTLADDGDALDILIMVGEPTFSGCLIEARVLGIFSMIDSSAADYKILAVPHYDPLFDQYQDLEDIPPHFLREVEFFFKTYKQLEGGEVTTQGWDNKTRALDEVDACITRFNDTRRGDRR